ncbi:WG repeat-containing protein [Pontibacter vulgaris]|uniref:WG repeat-containing protein n=1 Tax=Pontibacter vulgaris TaxID=2905679 RepID=UPI001FA6DAF5|nr:WG repeat-containing protein [Pontibacter vulgaris]
MIILKYSNLGKGLTRVLNPLSGLYGAMDTNTGEVVIRPKYTELHEFENERAVAIKDGKYLEVDKEGREYRDRQRYFDELDGMRIYLTLKADYCPACRDKGCEFCQGLGFIPINYDFDID